MDLSMKLKQLLSHSSAIFNVTTIFNLNAAADVLEYLGKLLEVKEHQGIR
jgi:hypothetical protein